MQKLKPNNQLLINKKLNIVYCSSNGSSVEHGRAMQIFSRLQKKSNLNITWIDPPISTRNIFQTLIQYRTKRNDKVYMNMDLFKPFGLPFNLSSKTLYNGTQFFLKPFLKRLNLNCDVLIVASPIFLEYAKLMKNKRIPIIYDCRDVFSKWKYNGEFAQALEKELLEICDITIAASDSIKEEELKISPKSKIISIPNGVPKSFISECNKKHYRLKPTIGFVGHLGYYVDLDLMIEIAKEKTEYNFIFVGDYRHIKKTVLKAPNNCEFLGEIPFSKLEQIFCTFDVGVIPFKLIDLTDAVFPIKLVEYFSKGIPVVSTPLRELKRLKESNLIYFANSKEEWIHKIEEALMDERSDEFTDFAKKYTWEELAEKYIQCFNSILPCNSDRKSV